MSACRIVLVDDHVLFREGLKRILGELADLEIIGESGNGLDLLKLLEKVTSQMVILDISMHNLRGIEGIMEYWVGESSSPLSEIRLNSSAPCGLNNGNHPCLVGSIARRFWREAVGGYCRVATRCKNLNLGEC